MQVSPEITNTWKQVREEPALIAWSIFIFLIPVYVFKSGLPQPGDIAILIVLPLSLKGWKGYLPPESRAAFRALARFTIWVCLVNYTWMIIDGNFQVFGPDAFMLFPLYYVYNTLVVLCALVLGYRYGDLFVRTTTYVVITSVFVLSAASFAFRTTGRLAVFFNNPNQLGFYALLVGTLIAFTHKRLRLGVRLSSATMLCCGYLAMISASRAAVAGLAILLVFQLFSDVRVIVICCLAAVGLVAMGGPISDAIDASGQRVLTRTGSHGFLEERGYDRIWEHYEYTVLGAGEGGYSRWDDTSVVKHMELHSSAGTVLFSYGAVGSVLLLMFLWRVVRRSGLRLTLLLLPPMLYTIAHQGLRFTMLWVFLAMFLLLKSTRPPKPVVAPKPVAA